ncbi:TIM barrel protein [Lichenihabitans sp. Uapishka_5]|nr:TIM barrel protein [Lichenihabitans sp. Uapishka_5]
MDKASISNIAWPSEKDDEALDRAATLGFKGIEVAPAKVFGSLDEADPTTVKRYRDRLGARQLAIPALQAIMFGVSDVHLFADSEARNRLALRLEQVCKIAAGVGAGACVFGSPTLRDPGNLDAAEAKRIAVDFFGRIGRFYAAHGVELCLEANPQRYKCRFVTSTQEAKALVEAVGEAGFSLHLDTGTVMINQEGADVVEDAARVAFHMHVSEPDLVPLGSFAEADHAGIAAAVVRSGYDGWHSVEMRASEDWQSAMDRAATVLGHYTSERRA